MIAVRCVRYDVAMKDIRRLLFNEQPVKESRKRRRAKWWAKHFGGCATWHICSAEPIRTTAPEDARPENLLELQVLETLHHQLALPFCSNFDRLMLCDVTVLDARDNGSAQQIGHASVTIEELRIW